MPSLFHKVDGEWRIERLLANRHWLSLDRVQLELEDAPPTQDIRSRILLIRNERSGTWAALVPDAVPLRHNGQPISTGLRVLAHGDSLATASAAPLFSLFFSSEETACIESFAGPEALSCPRCKDEILSGQEIVRCPNCGIAHHELVERPCWTYAETCSTCAQPTALDVGLRWTPGAL